MNKKILVSALFVGLSSSAFAAKITPSTSPLISALEVLNLPGENRRMAVEASDGKFYDSFISIAFNNKQTMNMRWKALMGAAEARRERSTPDLLRASKDNQWFMRNAALIALSEVNPKQGEKLAQNLLKDKALVVRSAAVSVLESHMSDEARDLLWAELDQKYNYKDKQSLWIRHQIVEVLAKKPKDHEMKVFAKLLTDKDFRVQLPAIAGLQKLTGVRLGAERIRQSELVALWKDYVKKENL